MSAQRRPTARGAAPRRTPPTARRGSAARPSAAPRTPARGSTRPQVRAAAADAGPGSRGRLSAAGRRRLVVFGGLLAVLTALLLPAALGYFQQRAQIGDLSAQVNQQRARVQSLQRERARWNDPAYVAGQARQRLGFAKPGERAYIVIDDTKQVQEVPSTANVRNDAAHADRPWYGQVWESALSAARTPASPDAK